MKRFLTTFLMVATCLTQTGCLNIQANGHVIIQETPDGTLYETVIVDGDGLIQTCESITGNPLLCSFSANGDIFASSARVFGLLAIVFAFIDPLVLQVPIGATNFSGTFDNGLGTSGNLAITLPVSSLPIDLNTNLVAEPAMQMVVVDFPGASTIALGQYHYTLKFDVPFGSGNVALKALFAGRVDTGGKTYYAPLLPCVTDFANVPSIVVSIAATGQPLLTPSFLSSMQGTGCNNKVYNYAAAGPATVSVPALDRGGLVLMMVLIACAGVAVTRTRSRSRRISTRGSST